MGLLEIGQGGGMVADRDRRVAAAPAAREIVGVDLQRPAEPPDRLAGLLGREVEHAQLADHSRVVGIAGGEFAEVADRGGVVFLLGRDQPPKLEGGRRVGLVLEDRLDVGQGRVGITRLLEDPGPQQEGGRVFGVDVDGAVDVLEGLVAVALDRPDPGPLQERADRVGFEVDRPAEGRLGIVHFFSHQAGQAERLLHGGIPRILLRGHLEILAGGVVFVGREPKQTTGPPHLRVARREFDRGIEEGGFLAGVFGQFRQHERGLGPLQPVVAQKAERLGGRLGRPLPVAPGQGLEPGDHQVSAAEFGVAAHHLFEIPHREGADPLPLLIRPARPEDRFGQHARPVDQGARVEILRELPRLLVEALVEGRATEVEHAGVVVEIVDRELGIDRLVEGFLARGVASLGGGRRRDWLFRGRRRLVPHHDRKGRQQEPEGNPETADGWHG